MATKRNPSDSALADLHSLEVDILKMSADGRIRPEDALEIQSRIETSRLCLQRTIVRVMQAARGELNEDRE